jgi:lipid-binding SYLF domain-containing protein
MKILQALLLVTCVTLVNIVFAADDLMSDEQHQEQKMTPEQAEKKRQEILAMSKETLDRLYKENPEVKKEIEESYGYAVFYEKTVNVLLVVGGTGYGVSFDSKTHTPIFMTAIRAGTGPGVGYKSSHGVYIFKTDTVYNQFTTIGMQIGASGDATAKLSGKGYELSKAVSLIPGVKYYQFTDKGLVLQANWGATEYLKDPQLNKK